MQPLDQPHLAPQLLSYRGGEAELQSVVRAARGLDIRGYSYREVSEMAFSGYVRLQQVASCMVVVVDRDRAIDPHLPHGPADVIDVSLERELGCVHADYHQSLAAVFPGPGADIGKLA